MLKPYRTKLLPARLKIEVGDAAKGEADALVVPAYQGERKHEILFDRTKARGVLSHLKAPDFKAGPKDGVLLRTLGRLPAPRLLVLGVGRPKEVGADRLRDFAGRAASKLKGKNVRRVAIDVPSRTGVSVDTAVEVMAEGALLALFEVEDFRKRNPEAGRSPAEFTFYIADRAALAPARRGLARGREIARYTNAARLLSTLPSNEKPPARLADLLGEVARAGGLTFSVLDEKELAKRGFQALLAVGKGSAAPPRMVVAEYRGGPKGAPPVALVGKGITFDTGGISLKPTFGAYPMWHMKWDMTGAAAVVCAAACAGALKLPVNLVAIACLAENMPSGSAYKPSDVVRAQNGVTIEVVNSDAEGRVVLADGLSHAQSFKPQAVVDVATLTGAIGIALGPRTSGLFSNSDELADRLMAAAKRTQDSLWRMPLFEWYDELIESPIADWKNSAGQPAGAGTAARFLEKFAGRHPWAHLDIASTAWTDRGKGEVKHPWQPRGTTATGVRLLVEALRAWKGPPKLSRLSAEARAPASEDDD
ncbi:MAG TPA: leucyl aminopeptidase [Candidatus Thermoplasmatota archaeon]|nr:leucyl aminopeptidase [Candidatus Thermoplasmatota archaeon]